MNTELIDQINNARVYDIAIKTPLLLAPLISQATQNTVWLKREDLQPVFSFKIRGAYNKIVQLSTAEKQKGIIAASAGNHAQGVALAAQKLNIKATIVMPSTTPQIKVRAVRNFGAEVVLHGDAYDDAHHKARTLMQAHDYTWVHPYDDLAVIAGQGTVAKEILEQINAAKENLDAVFIPVGGGGLLAGMAAFIKATAPEVQIIAVEANDSACFQAAWNAGKPTRLAHVGIFADGVAVGQIGDNTWDIAKSCVDDVITASTDEMCAAIHDIFNETRTIMEPAGALALAGMKNYIQRHNWHGKSCAVVTSGANLNFNRLAYIAERTELGEKKEVVFSVTIDEKPGSFLRFCYALEKRSITEFNYRYSHGDGLTTANVFVGVSLQDESKDDLLQHLCQENYRINDLSNNEMAKLHIRHMVGGHAPQGAPHELLFRFRFPERPGALLQFLTTLGKRWNISLFHYRNHGSAFGRVLIGLHAEHTDKPEIIASLKELGYPFEDESLNDAYVTFLK